MTHSASLQAAVALRALRGDLTPAEVAAQYGVTEAQVAAWRDRLAARAATVFETPAAEGTAPETGDVTRQKQAEHALRELEAERDQATQLLRAFADAVPGVVYAKDRDGRMLVANRGVSELVGKPPEFYLGRTDREFLDDPTQAEAVMANDRRIMDGGVAEQLEEAVTPPGGEPTVWLSTKAPFRDAQGRVIGIIGASMDITARKAAEDALAEALRAKDALLYEVNHRVKNNLQFVSSLLSLQLRTLNDESARAAIEEARTRVAVMASLHRELYQSGRHGSLDIGAWTRRLALDTFKLFGAGSRIALEFEAPPGLAMPVDRAVPLSLVLSELLTNALKYAFPGGRPGRIALRLSCQGERLRMHLSDDGAGLPASFDPQASAGLGMRIMQALLRQLDGRLTLGAADPGTTVLVEVPLQDSSAGLH